MFTATVISIVINISFLIFYSAYSKALKKLDFRLLSQIFLLEKGLDFTLVQLNKVIALTAISLASLAFCPGISSRLCQELLVVGLVHVFAHAIYSAIKYYGSNNIPYISKWPKMFTQVQSDDAKVRGKGIKKVSVVFGVFGEMALIATYFNVIGTFAAAGMLVIGLSVLHFYLMEID